MKVVLIGLLALLSSACSQSAVTAAVEPETDEQKTLYAIGIALSQQLQVFALSEEELEYIKAGIADGVMQRPMKVEMEVYGPKIKELADARVAVVSQRQAEASKEMIETAAAQPGAVTTESGAIVVPVTEGSGPMPKASDTVKVHYHGTLTDGTVFDSSVERGTPATFPLANVIKCWTEGVQKIKVGGKSRLVCPADVAYGDRGAPPNIKPGATLLFEVELLEIVN
ncbi:MAG TPA: FKBP-type peptidyl-prolyl cis-trans isomerase [Burkholderiales bacterium]|nr:FKBP-type peptidyl-prolyl cis-trans isomerase [Burkholderiales bacterium]